MNLLDELSHVNLDPAVLDHVRDLLQQTHHQADIIKLRDIKIQALTLELARYRRLQFGQKTEAFTSEQHELFDETFAIDIAAIENDIEQQAQTSPAPTKRARAGRQQLPEHLPRIEHRHEPESCSCEQCGQNLVKIGEDVSEQLDIEPARFFVHRHIRPQYACRHCETIQAAPVPAAIIDGGMAAPGLLAWMAVSKFVDHLPLYRLEQIASRQDVILSRSTLAYWVGRIGVALQPLADRLADLLRQRHVLHADETPVAQLDPGEGKTKRAYLWTYRSNDLETGPPIVVLDYQTSRSGRHVKAFLQAWKGHLMVDDYGGYKALFREGITELGCLTHVRRKFFDLHAANSSPVAATALTRIAQLYLIETEGKELAPAERQRLRQQKAKPVLTEFYQWLSTTRLGVAMGSALAKAIDYALKRWNALVRYADSGDLPIDNNPAENTLRPIAIGRKNWLFAGSERAGQRAAAIQSLLGTAKLNGRDPQAWLKETLEKLPTWPNSRIDELLPFA
jgi:transposase